MDCPNRHNIKTSFSNCKWTIGKEIGRGDQGAIVYQLCCNGKGEANCKYAIKVFDITNYSDIDELDRYIEKELEIYTKLDSKGLSHTYVPILEAYTCEEHGAYIIMESRDITIEDYVISGVLDYDIDPSYLHTQIDKMLKETLSLVNSLHSNKFIHGDLNPNNIMVDLDKDYSISRLSLIDFSMAKEVKSKAFADATEDIDDIELSFKRLHDIADSPSLAKYERSKKNAPKEPKKKKSTVKRIIEPQTIKKTALKSTKKPLFMDSPSSPITFSSPIKMGSFASINDNDDELYSYNSPSTPPPKTNRRLF